MLGNVSAEERSTSSGRSGPVLIACSSGSSRASISCALDGCAAIIAAHSKAALVAERTFMISSPATRWLSRWR
ncbi:hypothetical protein [Erythrobacter sp. NAP1]|uniref:hypothetical protein n=1 Tax=Erythrobacter sp. NAP1 TaxID=237727 RepID=UPI003528A7D4